MITNRALFVTLRSGSKMIKMAAAQQAKPIKRRDARCMSRMIASGDAAQGMQLTP
jgi:hypothetical protein